MKMKLLKQHKKKIITLIAVAFLTPLLTLIYLYWFAWNTGLPGRGGGPQDAFRHTYSTALTARYLSPKIVEFVTWACERNHSDPYDLMDIHNNAIGTKIGLNTGPLYETVWAKLQQGGVNVEDSDTITWLPKEKWKDKDFLD